MGLGYSGAVDIGTSARAPELSCRRRSFADAPFARDGQAAIKFNSFWTIELEPGWSLFATHPVNRDDLPFRLITGLVDADRFHDGGINFPAIWTQPDFSGVLPKGTPVAQVFAVPRAAPQLEFEAFDEAHKQAYAKTVAEVLASPNVYRKRFRARRGRGPDLAAERRRSAASSSHSRPWDAEVSAIAMVPKLCGPQPIGLRIGAHGAVEIAGFLQHDAEIERGFGVVGLYLDRLAVGVRGAGVVAQVLADEAEVEPDRRGSLTLRGAFQQACAASVVSPSSHASRPSRAAASVLCGNRCPGWRARPARACGRRPA